MPDETETIHSMGIDVGQHYHVDSICSASSSSPGILCLQHDMTLCGCQCSVQHQQHNNSSDENHTCNAGCVTKFKSVTPDRAQDSVSPDYSFCLLLYTVTDVLALSLRLTEHNTLPYNYYLEKLHSTCLPHVKGLRAPPCDVLA